MGKITPPTSQLHLTRVDLQLLMIANVVILTNYGLVKVREMSLLRYG